MLIKVLEDGLNHCRPLTGVVSATNAFLIRSEYKIRKRYLEYSYPAAARGQIPLTNATSFLERFPSLSLSSQPLKVCDL